jgi:hypothetical protein
MFRVAEVGTRNFIFETAIPQLKEALPQSQFLTFLKEMFRSVNFFLNPQFESFTSAIIGIFLAVESGRFLVCIETDSSKNMSG